MELIFARVSGSSGEPAFESQLGNRNRPTVFAAGEHEGLHNHALALLNAP